MWCTPATPGQKTVTKYRFKMKELVSNANMEIPNWGKEIHKILHRFTWLCMCTYTFVYMRLCMHALRSLHICFFLDARECVCLCVCVCVCVCVCSLFTHQKDCTKWHRRSRGCVRMRCVICNSISFSTCEIRLAEEPAQILN